MSTVISLIGLSLRAFTTIFNPAKTPLFIAHWTLINNKVSFEIPGVP
jgi:hypothetical protein